MIASSIKHVPKILRGHTKNVTSSVGMLLLGVEAHVAVNKPVELHIRAGRVALGYWKNPKATGETFKDGRLRTGDLVRVDADGVPLHGDRTADERVPRAWVVLSLNGEALGASTVAMPLDAWVRETLSRYKWLRGGIDVVKQYPSPRRAKVLRRELVEACEAESRMRATKL